VLCGPLFGLGVLVFKQSQNIYQVIVQHGGNAGSFISSINHSINSVLPPEVSFDLSAKVSNLIYSISNNIAKIFSTTLSAIFSFILLLLIIFYTLKDGREFKEELIKLSPLSEEDNKKILGGLRRAINAVIRGYLVIALAQGLLMGIGLWIFGVPNAALWAVVTAFTSMIPTIGTSLVSIPSIVFLYATGHTTSAIGLLVWALLLVGTIDNLLSPFVVGSGANLPPFMILFAVLGGVVLLGPIGLLIGPLAVSLLYTLISIYKNEYQGNTNQNLNHLI
jgi:predicted PurR-regulated permease PerM